MHCMMIPDHHMRCMTIPTNTSSARALHDDTIITFAAWRYPISHTLLDDSIHLKLCMMIPIITMIAWWYPSTQISHDRYHSSQALHDDTIHYKPCMMLPFITSLAWWYLSSQTLHNESVLSSDAWWKQLKRRNSGPVKDNWGLSRMFLGFTTWNCRALS